MLPLLIVPTGGRFPPGCLQAKGKDMPRIAVDAMGGDHAPGVVVRGTYKFAQSHANSTLLLVGQEAVVKPLLAECGPALPNIAVVHAPDVIDMHEHPVEALRKKKHNSLSVGCKLVAEGKADAIMSAGNTGGLVAASTLILRTLPGVIKAGILANLPTISGRVVLMDVGANVDAKAAHLQQYAAMGEVFYREIVTPAKDAKIRVGLLSVGSEEGKGSALIRESHELLRRTDISFAGNCEGHDIFEGNVEVVVCDGETGNVVLKVAEGVVDVVTRKTFGYAKDAGLNEDGRWRQVAGSLIKTLDWRDVGGAILLGVNGIVIIAHGRSDERAIMAGIRVAAECAERHVNDKIVSAIERIKNTAKVA